MSEMNFGAIDVGMTFVSVFVSIVFLFYLIKDKKSEKQYKRFDALVKFQDINKEYSCLLADVYCDIKDILADFINISEKVYDKIYHKIDIYKNKDKLNLRHNLNMRVINFEMDVKNDVLMQSIEYLSKSKIATIYTTHDSDLSNKKYEDNQAEFHLSILYENFNMHYMSEYCDFVQIN
ncbi:hypothetical protein [Campylobacter majalis]|uniref:hypothetical protein n=1 Tax=Campylobacter majalis TaxID=2790656 RepID=UPI003D6857D6